MGKIFYIMGKSSSGKDTIFKSVSEQMPELKTIV
ncbi:MAG: guanylate kinase, partial [Lachnospiraceae bacterium]